MGTSVLLYEPYFPVWNTRHHGIEQRASPPLPAGVRMPSFLSQALASEMCPCPLWVNSGRQALERRCLLTPRKRTSGGWAAMSA